MSKHDTKFQADASQIPKGYDRPGFNEMAQYGYGRTILREMTSDDANVSNVTSAAIRAGMDVVYGESHDVISSTMGNIISDIKNSPAGSIKGIALEFPPELQSLFDPKTISTISEKEFNDRFISGGRRATVDVAKSMELSGEITKEQYSFIEDMLSDYDIPLSDNVMSVYQMALVAHENNIPVYAADDNIRRAVGMVLNKSEDPNIIMSLDQSNDILVEGIDDTSDVKYLVQSGVDINAPGSLIIHRGLGHINGYYETDEIVEKGFDDILERKGRSVATVAVVSPHNKRFLDAVDTADFDVIIRDGEPVVLQGDYQQNHDDENDAYSPFINMGADIEPQPL